MSKRLLEEVVMGVERAACILGGVLFFMMELSDTAVATSVRRVAPCNSI